MSIKESGVLSFPEEAARFDSDHPIPQSLGGFEAGCKALDDSWPRWLIVCRGLVGVSLAPGICQEFNFMQIEVGRKRCSPGTCKPSRVLD